MKKTNNISIYLHPSIVEALKDCEPRGRSMRLAIICQAWLNLPLKDKINTAPATKDEVKP